MQSLQREQQLKSNKETKTLIKAGYSRFWEMFFEYSFEKMIKKNFHAFRVKNLENYNLIDPSKSTIFYGFHCCWWDGMIAYTVCKQMLNTNLHMMIEELHRLPALSKIGAFSINKSSPQESIKSLKYAANVLKNPQNALWIYPQGKVNPPDYRPIEFSTGLAYICDKLDGVNLVPMANRYNFIREDKPEVFVELGKPIILEKGCVDRKELTKLLEDDFTKFLDAQKADVQSGKYDDYEFYFKNQLCFVKRLEKVLNILNLIP